MQIDGVLFLNDEITANQYQLLKDIKNKYGIPLVLVNTSYRGGDDLLSVAINYEKAGYEVTKSLVQEGRKRIALFTTQKRYQVSYLKEQGYSRAVKEFGLEPLICYTTGNLDAGRNDIKDFLDQNDIDAVIGVRDSIAIAVMNQLIDRGKRIPEDVSIIGFDNLDTSSTMHPPLTSVNVLKDELGQTATELLLNRIKFPDTPIRSILLSVELDLKRSVRRIK
jgi:LacI family transcriptional regulator